MRRVLPATAAVGAVLLLATAGCASGGADQSEAARTAPTAPPFTVAVSPVGVGVQRVFDVTNSHGEPFQVHVVLEQLVEVTDPARQIDPGCVMSQLPEPGTVFALVSIDVARERRVEFGAYASLTVFLTGGTAVESDVGSGRGLERYLGDGASSVERCVPSEFPRDTYGNFTMAGPGSWAWPGWPQRMLLRITPTGEDLLLAVTAHGSAGSGTESLRSMPLLQLDDPAHADPFAHRLIDDAGFVDLSRAVPTTLSPPRPTTTTSVPSAPSTTTAPSAPVPSTSAPSAPSTTTGAASCGNYVYNDTLPLSLCEYGYSVEVFQQFLVDAGFAVTVDGYFGPGTQDAVVTFQADQGLEVTGLIDVASWAQAPILLPGIDLNGDGVVDGSEFAVG